MNPGVAESAAVPPVRREVLVQAPPPHVFRTFTESMDAWWPRGYKLGKAPLQRMVLETRIDGRLYEVDQDGTEVTWGKVLVWDPPGRLVLAWQINGQWQYDPAFVTEVELTFAAQGPGATQVVLEHRNLDRYGAVAEHIRKASETPQGWRGILERFAKAAALAP